MDSRATILVVVVLLGLASVAGAQAFDNGTQLGCARKGFINIRLDDLGNPKPLAQQGQERMTMALPPSASWTVKIPRREVKDEILQFVGSNAHSQSGTGSIDIKFTSAVAEETALTIVVVVGDSTLTLKSKVITFVLLPEFAKQPAFPATNKQGKALPGKIDCTIKLFGAPGDKPGSVKKEAKTTAKFTPKCGTASKFDDCARACNIKGEVESSGNVRVSVVELRFGSKFRVASKPRDECINGKTVQVDFTAKEEYDRSEVVAFCKKVPDGGGAEWKWSGTHTAPAAISPPAIDPVTAGVDCPFIISGGPNEHKVTKAGEKNVKEGILAPVSIAFKINDAEFGFYKVEREQKCRAVGNGSFAKGNITYGVHPLLVRLVPKPVF